MLTGLSVRNIVLIDQLDLGLDAGLTVLTGETGAGKSILLDALTLALGGRGDAALVRAGAESGQVVAVFQLPADHPAREMLRDSAVAADEDAILKRIQYADGRTRAFINDQPVSAGLLRGDAASNWSKSTASMMGERWSDTATHRAALHFFDAFGDLASDAAIVRTRYEALAEADDAVAAQRAAVAEGFLAQEEYARHVVEELSVLKPEAGEEEELAERRQHLMQLERAAEDVNEADELLSGSAAPGPALISLMRRLTRKRMAGRCCCSCRWSKRSTARLPRSTGRRKPLRR